jgi:hypothetical protein
MSFIDPSDIWSCWSTLHAIYRHRHNRGYRSRRWMTTRPLTSSVPPVTPRISPWLSEPPGRSLVSSRNRRVPSAGSFLAHRLPH